MIWFTCKKCSKTHGRNETSAGTMVFCDCGQGNTVPWESTTSEPAAAPVAEAPKGPDLAPIQFDPTKSTGGASAPPSYKPDSKHSSKPPPIEEEERPYRRGRTEKRDPEFCFNHQRRPKAEACAECEENFCPDCLVQFQGVLLCAPCKNFRARRAELPPAASTMATASLMISLIAGPLMMCFLLWQPGSDLMRILSWMSLLFQLAGLAFGAWALYDAERDRKAGGQWVAVAGVTASSLTIGMIVLLNLVASRVAMPT